MPSLNNVTVTAKFRCHPSSRPPRPAPAPPADFSVTLRLLSRRGHYSGPSSSAAAARTGFYCTASLDTGHRPRRTEHSCGKSLVFSPRQCCVSPVRVRGGGQRHGDRRHLLGVVTPTPSPSLTPPRPSRGVRVQCSAWCGATARHLIK